MEVAQQDFKYVIQDFSHVYFGGRCTYEELAEADDAPLQLKRVIRRVIKREVPLETVVEEHLLTLTEDSDSFLLYEQLKASIEVVFARWAEQKGKQEPEYESRTYTIRELLQDETLHAAQRDFLIREIHFKKLKLLSISV
ncbi:MAG: hypothetical protein IJ711_11345 [Lachnospiraceae bacterium]|nr:hypothetical protein [Lachnospiraceae bacterium]